MTQPNPERDVVLIVDDVPENLAVLSDALDGAGFMVLVAQNGAEALNRLQLITPHVILLDAVMPGIDGFETCRRIKAADCSRNIPVVFMTGLTETEHVVRAFAAGGIDYVTKPINPEQVLARMRAHLRTARLIAQAQEAIDAAGLAVAVVNRHGHCLWLTPKARNTLETFFPGLALSGTGLPDEARQWVRNHLAPDSGPAPRGEVFMHGNDPGRLCIHFLGALSGGQYLLLVEQSQIDAGGAARLKPYKLTAREIEVLMWVAKGKTNRDIAEILGMSPRTVNKHLEHIYVKLGVETRTAAAAIAMSIETG
jgi:DNA-binding NarL/FixJ family response regulator